MFYLKKYKTCSFCTHTRECMCVAYKNTQSIFFHSVMSDSQRLHRNIFLARFFNGLPLSPSWGWEKVTTWCHSVDLCPRQDSPSPCFCICVGGCVLNLARWILNCEWDNSILLRLLHSSSQLITCFPHPPYVLPFPGYAENLFFFNTRCTIFAVN